MMVARTKTVAYRPRTISSHIPSSLSHWVVLLLVLPLRLRLTTRSHKEDVGAVAADADSHHRSMMIDYDGNDDAKKTGNDRHKQTKKPKKQIMRIHPSLRYDGNFRH